MNIFYLDENPKICAEYMVDKHIVKMCLEIAQLLSTAHRLAGSVSDDLYKATHINHPCSKWTRASINNYSWLYEHFIALLDEYTFRYNKVHACSKLLSSLSKTPEKIPQIGFTLPRTAMDATFIISNDPIINYRNYYQYGKSHIHKWTKRDVPCWLKLKEITTT